MSKERLVLWEKLHRINPKPGELTRAREELLAKCEDAFMSEDYRLAEYLLNRFLSQAA